MPEIEAPPRASILIESMRDIGYTLETALADVIDNSITAGATNIHIHVDTVGAEVKVGIVDDGQGMNKNELVDSMRLGSRHPKEARAIRDLGRFGLGLKTASFSQCRRLTVVARKAGETSVAIWDLEHVARAEKWALLIPDSAADVPFIEKLGAEGALVVWEQMDREVEQAGSESARKHFVRRLDETRRHLELVFHRYLAGEPGLGRVKVLVNEVPLKPFDPFHSGHPATMRGQTEQVQVNDHVVEITPFTLPHHRNVTAPLWEHYAGVGGYLKNQGFYLYREKRLILHGTWFGLARQMELTKLTRVRIDMPNGLDADWHVDVKKAWARPPMQVRERLQRIITEIGAPSRIVFTRRGRVLHDSSLPIWQRVQDNNAIVYRLNPENPILKEFQASVPQEAATAFQVLLQAVTAGLPMDAIFADLAGNPESVRAEAIPDESLVRIFEATYASLIGSGINQEMIPQMLRVSEPFRSYWERTETLLAQSATAER